MRLIVDDRDSFALARVVFGFQCQECGEEHRIGLNGSDLRLLRPRVLKDVKDAETHISEMHTFQGEVIACSKCGSTGSVLFTAERTCPDWVEPEIS